MEALLVEVRDAYDCVLLDSTPMLNLSDGPLTASLAEGVIVVVSSARTRHPNLQHALRQLEHVGTPILGLVYNRSEDIPALKWSIGRQM
jgi:Mrp family chromosome partitioning ATPase